MKLSADKGEEWDKFLQEKIINKYPDLYSEKKNRKVLKELLALQGEFQDRYVLLAQMVRENPEVAKHLYEWFDWYPDMKSKNGLLNHELSKSGLSPHLDKHLGNKLSQSNYSVDPRNAELVEALQIILRYIETAGTEEHKLRGMFEGCPDPPSNDLRECAAKLSDPSHPYKEQCKDTILERFVEDIYRRGLERARSNMRSNLEEPDKVENPPAGEITAGINVTVKNGIRSASDRGLIS